VQIMCHCLGKAKHPRPSASMPCVEMHAPVRNVMAVPLRPARPVRPILQGKAAAHTQHISTRTCPYMLLLTVPCVSGNTNLLLLLLQPSFLSYVSCCEQTLGCCN
jgi:hypothetical protein